MMMKILRKVHEPWLPERSQVLNHLRGQAPPISQGLPCQIIKFSLFMTQRKPRTRRSGKRGRSIWSGASASELAKVVCNKQLEQMTNERVEKDRFPISLNEYMPEGWRKGEIGHDDPSSDESNDNNTNDWDEGSTRYFMCAVITNTVSSD